MDIGESYMNKTDAELYSATDISLMLGGIAAAIATIVYSLKHVKQSSCLCFKCSQVVVDEIEPMVELNHDNDDMIHLSQIEALMKSNIITNSEV